MNRYTQSIVITDPQVLSLVNKRLEQIKKSTRKKVTPEEIINKHLVKHLKAALIDPGNIYEAHRKELLKALWVMEPHICIYCGIGLSLRSATIDHRIPLSREGRPAMLDNLGLACHDCNSEKDCLTEWEYRVVKLLIHT